MAKEPMHSIMFSMNFLPSIYKGGVTYFRSSIPVTITDYRPPPVKAFEILVQDTSLLAILNGESGYW